MNTRPINNQSAVEVVNVTSIGNAWIITKSKSHPGRIYYFNTQTGEAVWNLSNTDIEKAKKTTKFLQNQPGTNLENYPEPNEPPTDDYFQICNKHKVVKDFTPSSGYNRQTLNNQNQRRHLKLNPFVSSQCIQCTSLNTFDSSVASMSSTPYNPNIWTIPPNHQIVITPPQLPVINETQTSVNVAYNNTNHEMLVQNTTSPQSRYFKGNRFTNYDNRYRRFGAKLNEFNPGFHCNNFYQRSFMKKNTFYNKFNRPSTLPNKDLRQILCTKRQLSGNKSKDNNSQETSNTLQIKSPQKNKSHEIRIINSLTEELCPSDVDDIWLKEHAFVEGTQLKLNIEPLKHIVVSKGGLHCWYIVTDFNVLLNHFNLINITVNSDEQCQLMISKNTMTVLKTTSKSADNSLMNRALVVLKLLAQQFAAQRAVLGIESGESNNYSIYDFSVKLSEQNNNVALITDNITLKAFGTESISVFTIKELKDILKRTPGDLKPKLQNNSNESITITIANHMDFMDDVDIDAQNETKCPVDIDKEIINASTNNTIAKKTLEIGVQTDCIEIPSKNNDQCDHIQNVNTKNENDFGSAPKNGGPRLIRNISHQSNSKNEPNSDKRQFVWRRKRRTTHTILDKDKDVTDSNLDNITVSDNNAKATVTDCDNLATQNNNTSSDTYCEQENEYKTSHDDNYCSSETTNSSFIQKYNNKEISVEETSTSGIISNTVSNYDSESEHSVIPTMVINMANYDNYDKCVMFEIESPAMEESLKMKSDEWVSRFVQIMEEVLTEILQQDPPFCNAMLPPPWSLHEAAECIKKKFSNDSDTVDSASKLTNVLYKISDARGKINMKLEPAQFMEMYSYGVYLVDSLQTHLNECEDLHTAQESLANLLSDIQDPNTYNIQNDTFSDNNNDDFSANVTPSSSTVAAITESYPSLTNNIIEEQENVNKSQSLNENNDSNDKYYLKSAENKQDEVGENQAVKFIRNIDQESTFFFTLNLKRKPVEQCILKPLKPIQGNETVETQLNDAMECKDVPEPIIIRNFSRCVEFENRLKKNKEREVLDMDSLDYTEEDFDYNYYDEEFNSDYDYYSTEDYNELSVTEDNNKNLLSEDVNLNNQEINDFKWIAGKIMNVVRVTFSQVHVFCEKVREELQSIKSLSPSRRQEIKEQAQEAHKHMCNLNTVLRSILHREENCYDDSNNIQTILKKAEVFVDTEISNEYSLKSRQSLLDAVIIEHKLSNIRDYPSFMRDKIAKCVEQSTALMVAVNMVIEAI